MSRFLLDTHTLLWITEDHPQLSPTVRDIVENSNHQLSISIVSWWELAIKISRGKLDLGCPLDKFMRKSYDAGLAPCNLEPRHAAYLATLDFHHSDPFDRALAAQSILDHLPLLSRDGIFDLYGVDRRW